MPSPSYIGNDAAGNLLSANDAAIGPTSEETGIMLNSLSSELDNPSVPFFDRYGGEVGFAVNHRAKLIQTLTGEVADASAGVNAYTFTAALTVANENYFASSSQTHGGIDFTTSDTRLVGMTFGQDRESPRSVTANLERPRDFTFT